jgi:hypothetical protein
VVRRPQHRERAHRRWVRVLGGVGAAAHASIGRGVSHA